MAKVTDLNECWIRIAFDVDRTPIEKAAAMLQSGLFMTLIKYPNGAFCELAFHNKPNENDVKPKEIYFNDGEFFDEPMVFQDSDLLNIPWTDGSIDEQGFTWSNGDKCVINRSTSNNELLSDVGVFYAETETHYWLHGIGGGDRLDKKGNLYQKDKYWLSKPETEVEKKTRELAEEVNRICYDLFGTPAFNCNQDIVDTVEKFIANGYKKAD